VCIRMARNTRRNTERATVVLCTVDIAVRIRARSVANSSADSAAHRRLSSSISSLALCGSANHLVTSPDDAGLSTTVCPIVGGELGLQVRTCLMLKAFAYASCSSGARSHGTRSTSNRGCSARISRALPRYKRPRRARAAVRLETRGRVERSSRLVVRCHLLCVAEPRKPTQSQQCSATRTGYLTVSNTSARAVIKLD
jgi:hypothetical protein